LLSQTAASRFFDILSVQVDCTAIRIIKTHQQIDVRFDHVSFGYQADQPVIKDLSFDISAGSVVAIVGPTA
jgi:ATP-binding cassette subfamily B multidrug efflux pump